MKWFLILLLFGYSLAHGQRLIHDSELQLGNDVAEDITIKARNGDVNFPFIKYDDALGEWRISNDGTTNNPISPLTLEGTNPNHVINGNFDFWQRGTSSTTTDNGYFTADRWRQLKTAGSWTMSRQAITAGDIDGSEYFFRMNTITGGLATSYSVIETRLEDVTKYAGKTFTLSFYAKADAAKNFSIEFVKVYGTGGSAADTGLCVAKLGATTAWQRFTVTCAVPDNTAKTIGTSSYLSFLIWAEAGSDFNARTNTLGTQNIVLDIAQVKLEEGSITTPFVLAGGTLTGELAACQRYYEKSYDTNDNPATNTSQGLHGVTVKAASATNTFHTALAKFKAQKRLLPTITFYPRDGSPTGSCQRDALSAGAGEFAFTGAGTTSQHGVALPAITTHVGLTVNVPYVFYCHWTADAEL